MEAIITVVGFLGAGKTTLLKHLMIGYIDKGWKPFIILNDYENANLDAQQFIEQIESKQVRALSGSCICCSGINELRDFVNRIPKRTNGITLIEANGTSDACSLMSFLGVGLNDRFLPPVQISVVDVRNWQKRGEHNELEANQIQVSSLIVLTHIENIPLDRLTFVVKELHKLNPLAEIINMDKIDVSLIPKLSPSKNNAQKFEHLKTHWSSCSTDLPSLPNSNCIYDICNAIPKSVLRVKGCTQIGNEEEYTYFERTPNGEVHVRPFNGVPITGSKLLTIGPGSEPKLLEKAIKMSLLQQNKNEFKHTTTKYKPY
ncbi:G3E family GTPase [Aquimarina sp. EL_43]|uniref:GTP-binding protein n=1 Tax=unclassified Aquimarina TaxID=2627091 RepID=UPI0018CBEC78|nr:MULTISPECIES: GTP-binding protein [unclassified Aquimarina]MBG6129166.1 G3E family GTPase [Aquimarina sp. EL_35]MBG6150231.1 G3E family GTPase [Aquimarina sp. EL_32]MBG6167084.1 G3E family GTPase [Aquimarina sp. EL_43]